MKRRTCAIVGAGEGLGRALAAKFASHSFDMALMSRTEEGSAAAADAAAAADEATDVRFFPADATLPETVETALSQVRNEMGEIEILIYNARGSFNACEPLEMTYEDLLDVYRLEVVGAFAAAKAVLPDMIDRSGGALFFSSATAAFRGSATFPLYAIGKFGLRALSQSLTKAYARHGVHIAHFRLDCDLDVPVMREIYGDGSDRGRLADPGDIAETYWLTYRQPKGAWSNEIEIRPHTETWTY
jgi:NAD(P)-dependent dehydrogenase (short-subunit alcohol dehydrogenase family)